MKKKSIWKEFETTGSIHDYLAYKREREEKKKKDKTKLDNNDIFY